MAVEKIKIRGLFWSYQLKCNANLAHLVHFFRFASGNFNFDFLFFLIAMDAEVKNIEIQAPAFFKHNNSSVATVNTKTNQNRTRYLAECMGSKSISLLCR